MMNSINMYIGTSRNASMGLHGLVPFFAKDVTDAMKMANSMHLKNFTAVSKNVIDVPLDPDWRPEPIIGNVYKDIDGKKFVVTQYNIEELTAALLNYQFVCHIPHEDQDYSYSCGLPWCKCAAEEIQSDQK